MRRGVRYTFREYFQGLFYSSLPPLFATDSINAPALIAYRVASSIEIQIFLVR
jgi:hypothetical protein